MTRSLDASIDYRGKSFTFSFFLNPQFLYTLYRNRTESHSREEIKHHTPDLDNTKENIEHASDRTTRPEDNKLLLEQLAWSAI